MNSEIINVRFMTKLTEHISCFLQRTVARLSASPTNAFQGTISLGRSWTLF